LAQITLGKAVNDIDTLSGYNAKLMIYPDGKKRITVADCFLFKNRVMKNVVDNPLFDDIPLERVKKAFEPTEEDVNDIPICRDDSVRRARNKVFDIAMLNGFTHFVTWTLNKEYVDRYDKKEIAKQLKIFLKNMVARYGLKYIIIPEYHKDCSIHFHGLISGNIRFVDSGTRQVKGFSKPLRIETCKRKRIPAEEQRTVFNMPQWKLGFSTAIELYGEKENAVRYVLKYISKDLKEKILGNFYYAGGDIEREPTIFYMNLPFEQIKAKIYPCEATGVNFKYITEKELNEIAESNNFS